MGPLKETEKMKFYEMHRKGGGGERTIKNTRNTFRILKAGTTILCGKWDGTNLHAVLFSGDWVWCKEG